MTHISPDHPVTLITGAGAGIGRATAVMLAERGHALALAGRTEKTLRETADLCALKAPGVAEPHVIVADVGEPRDARRMIDETIEHFGRLDALVNNAGVALLLPIEESTEDVLRQAFDVNAIGPGLAIHHAWPIFVRQKGGCIVNVSTRGTQDPFPGFFAYAASKAAVNLYAKSCATEGKKHNIRAFSVAPGAVETKMLRALFDEKTLPTDACLAPEDVAAVIVACILGERDSDNGDTIWLSR
ncbi:MAG: SDR family oxidoreductase [Phycisphaeraceae bacterium]|nr:MAG: SDR family oxidoreductase [Phycisphaeraceae bacterium]